MRWCSSVCKYLKELSSFPLKSLLHEFLLKGGVFSEDLVEAWIAYKRSNEVDVLKHDLTELIVNGLDTNSRFIRKQLWRHKLEKGVTEIIELDEDANELDKDAISHPRFFEGMVHALERFDRQGHYFN